MCGKEGFKIRIPPPCFGSQVVSPSSMEGNTLRPPEEESQDYNSACYVFGAFFKQGIIVHGKRIDCMDFGGRSGSDFSLCQLASCVNNLSFGCLVSCGEDWKSSSLTVT